MMIDSTGTLIVSLLRLISALFTMFSLFLLMITFRNSYNFYFKWWKEDNININLVFGYSLYFAYIICVNIILLLINYWSISLESINNLWVDYPPIQELYLFFSLLILGYGAYYSIRYLTNDINLNNNISFIGKITLLLVPFIFIIIRFGLVPKLGNLSYIVPSTIYCESTNGREEGKDCLLKLAALDSPR